MTPLQSSVASDRMLFCESFRVMRNTIFHGGCVSVLEPSWRLELQGGMVDLCGNNLQEHLWWQHPGIKHPTGYTRTVTPEGLSGFPSTRHIETCPSLEESFLDAFNCLVSFSTCKAVRHWRRQMQCSKHRIVTL